MIRRIDDNGYVRDHHGKLVHRELFQNYYHCCLLKWGRVHHINEIKYDNRIDNLQGMTTKQHNEIHHRNNKYRSRIKFEERECYDCKSKETHKSKYGYECWNYIDGNLVCRRCYSRFKVRERNLKKPNFKIRNPELGSQTLQILNSKTINSNPQNGFGELQNHNWQTGNIISKSGKLIYLIS